ncbi:hypothetical protein AB0442_23230 [Kitasatospora sp. NPDC085895]|uniref:hypothetical protein n=1 Tax=Kitasatospora sp. NPDC085895 TaxID=3155057 RepID=UPI00344C7E4D
MDVESLHVEEPWTLRSMRPSAPGTAPRADCSSPSWRAGGEDDLWQSVLFLLGVLATRPVYGLPERRCTGPRGEPLGDPTRARN